MYAVMCIPSCFSANLARAPATTREIVSRLMNVHLRGGRGCHISLYKYSRHVTVGRLLSDYCNRSECLVLVPYNESYGAACGFSFEDAGEELHLSPSFRAVVIRDCPGRRRSSSAWTKSISMTIPAGNPSITPPTPLPSRFPKTGKTENISK